MKVYHYAEEREDAKNRNACERTRGAQKEITVSRQQREYQGIRHGDRVVGSRESEGQRWR